MTKENTMSIRRIYSILLSIVIVIAGLCLIAACLTIYHSGSQPFSRESVAAAFSKIAIWVYLCLAMIIVSGIWEWISPSAKEKPPVYKPYRAMLKRQQEKKDIRQCSEAVRKEIADLQKKRRQHVLIRTIVFLVCSVIFLVYAVDGSHFHQSQINDSMINAMKVLVPCMLVSFCYAFFVSIYEEKSIAKELELMKQAPAAAAAQTTAANIPDDAETRLRPYRNLFLAAAVISIVYGFITGGTVDVLAKAINICTECIGLG